MRTEEQVALKRFQNVIGMLHSQISQHRNGNIFHNPIKNSEAPDYREIVKRPSPCQHKAHHGTDYEHSVVHA